MPDRSEAAFIEEHADELRTYWDRLKYPLCRLKQQYSWPRGAALESSLNARTQLEERIREELDEQGSLSKSTFDAVIQWGFGGTSGCSDQEVLQATRLAFWHLKAAHIAAAARELVKLPRVGISRASKILALSDQRELGIYDSRSAHGLSDLLDRAGRRLVTIPPGRVITGDPRSKDGYCRAFEEYIWVLRCFRKLAGTDPSLRSAFSRVADLEIALFMRSRSGDLDMANQPIKGSAHLQGLTEHNEEDAFWTLGPGRKAKQFFAIVDTSSVTIFTGEKKTALTLDAQDVQVCLTHFGSDEFPLSNSKTALERDPQGLGEYFARNFGSSVFASHFAALWVHQGFLEATRKQGAWRLRVIRVGQQHHMDE